MAQVKISELPSASSLTGSEVLPVVQGGSTLGATVNQIKDKIQASTLNVLKMNASSVQTLAKIGELAFNPDTQTLEVKCSAEVTLSIGQENYIRGKNAEADTILNGTVVYVSGGLGANSLIKRAGNADGTAERVIGVATQDIGANNIGFVTTSGIVNKLNTSAYLEGDLLWLGANGAMTNVKPDTSVDQICIGVVLMSHANEGSILVAVKDDWRDKLAEVRSDLNTNIIGNTLFDKVGYISFSDGTLINTDFWRATDYIPVEEGDTVRIKANIGAGAATLACYSSNKSYLKDKSIEIATSMEIDNTYTIPAGVTYMRTCSLKSYPASTTVILVNSLLKKIVDLQTDLNADELLLNDINNNALRKSVVGMLGDNLITSETIFTDGKYVKTNDNSLGDLAEFSYCSVPVVSGKTYRFTAYTDELGGNFVCRVLNASGTYVMEKSIGPYFNSILSLGGNVIEITIPSGGVILQINVLITQKSTAFVKQLYSETDKLPINWLEVTEENFNDELKEKLNNPQINGDFTIFSQETLTGYSYSTGGFKRQVSDTEISISNYDNIHSAIITGVTEGDILLVSNGQIIDPNSSLGKNYYVFGKTETVPAIKISEIGNYVELYDEANKVYKITIPKDCTIFYYTITDETQSTSFIKKCVTKKALNWLEVTEENLDPTIIAEVENTVSSNVQSNIETGQLDYSSNYHIWDSINKPIDFIGKKLIAFGDSITSGVSSPGLVQLGSTKYISLFCSHVGAILTNQAISGSTITDNGSQYAMCKRVVQYATSEYDIIYIAGGTNDYNQNMAIGNYDSTDQTTLYGALRAICEHLKTNCPNAVVIFVTPIPYTSVARRTKTEIQKLDTVRSAIYDIATLYGYNVVDGKNLGMPKTSGNWNHAMVYDSDGCHPTELGHSLYARCLAGKLL